MGYLLNVVYGLALLFASPWLICRAIRTKRYRAGWKEKVFGLVPRSADSQRVIWLHAVSVGEIQLLRTLVWGIEQRFPECSLCISTTTRAGMEIAEKAFKRHRVFYFPLDFTWAVRNAMRRIRPSLLVLVELEVWPNLVDAARRASCPVAIVNGRLSQRSFVGYSRIRWLIGSYFEQLKLVAVQDAAYGQRFKALGVKDECLMIAGNMKFDGATCDRSHPEVQIRREQLGLSRDDLVWVVGSTQAPEEEYAIEAYRRLKLDFPRFKMIVVPRQPDRFEEVGQLLEMAGFHLVRRSQMGDGLPGDWEIMLGDTVGELRWWWGLADLAFVGGSFGDRGGQNMIEPAAFGVSTAVGPNTKNFADTVRILLDAKAITQLGEANELYAWAYHNLIAADLRKAIGERASQAAAAHRGALERTLDAIAPIIVRSFS